MKILAIDDAKAVHSFLDHALHGSKYVVTHCYNAKEGHQVFNQEGPDFKAILLDWEMPELDGPSLLNILRSAGVQIPIIMVTSKNKTEDIARMLAAGASDYIMKPFTPDILIAKLDTILGCEA